MLHSIYDQPDAKAVHAQPGSALEGRAHRGDQPTVGVARDELDAREPAGVQASELRQPAGLGLGRADVGTVIHSNQGVQFGSWAFTDRAKASGLVPSMGSVGDCYDNSMIESFWSRMQVELLDRKKWKTRVELANAMLDYLEIWHNRRRRHSQLGWLSPIEFERVNTITVA